MLVWGGVASSTGLATGGLYDPVSDSWTSMNSDGAPGGRTSNLLAWANESLLVWGGYSAGGQQPNTGAVYAIAPTSSVTPTAPVTGEALTCTIAEGVTDPDEEDVAGLNYEFTWLRNGVSMLVHTSSNRTDTLSPGIVMRGEVWSCRVRAFDSSGAATASGLSSAVTINQTAYETWKSDAFTAEQLADPAISGDLATPAHDGHTNLMKYALGQRNPMACSTSYLPTPSVQGDYLTLTYRQSKQATDVIYRVESSGSLASADWTPATVELSRIDKGDHWLVTTRDSVPSAGYRSRFMRLKVQR